MDIVGFQIASYAFDIAPSGDIFLDACADIIGNRTISLVCMFVRK